MKRISQNSLFFVSVSRATVISRAPSDSRSSQCTASLKRVLRAPKFLVSLVLLLCMAMVLPAQSEASGGKQGSSFSEWEQIPGSKRQTSNDTLETKARTLSSNAGCERLLEGFHPGLPLPELDALLCEFLAPAELPSRSAGKVR